MSDRNWYRVTKNDRVITEAIDFGFTDDKGRKIGYCLIVNAMEWEVTETGGGGYSGNPAFQAYMTATRDGETFGSGRVSVSGDTLEAVTAASRKKIATARARYAKKFL